MGREALTERDECKKAYLAVCCKRRVEPSFAARLSPRNCFCRIGGLHVSPFRLRQWLISKTGRQEESSTGISAKTFNTSRNTRSGKQSSRANASNVGRRVAESESDFFVRLGMSDWIIFFITLLSWEFLLEWYNFF